MPYLYVNTKGTPWRKHSYSAGLDFDLCPFKYFMRRVQGWKQKDNWARFLFGKALESAVQFHHEHDGIGAREEFHRLWAAYKDRSDLLYTRVEKDWANCDVIGDELLRLYAIRQPMLPLPLGGQIAFQREISKEVFPGDPTYGEIQDAGKLDVIAWVEPNHPLLPKIDWKPEMGMLRQLIVDIKTTDKDFPEEAGIAAFDDQLRRYSWQSGIHDVALLSFKKAGRMLKKGVSVTLLEDVWDYNPFEDETVRCARAGQERVVAAVDGDMVYLVSTDWMLEEMDRVQGEKNGKTDQTNAAKARAREWLEGNSIKVRSSAITRQRVQFNAGFVTKESQEDAGQACANQVVGIVNSWRSKKWPNKFGIRFPHDNRQDPYFRAFILKDEAYKKENFVKSDEETIDDLFADESQEEE